MIQLLVGLALVTSCSGKLDTTIDGSVRLGICFGWYLLCQCTGYVCKQLMAA